MRVTGPRLGVYGALAELGGHRSVDEVVARLRSAGASVPRASVYNSIDALVRAGVALAADAGPGRALYEAGEGFHHHFVCRRCGAVRDVPCVVGEKPCLEATFDGGTVDEAQVIFRGLCASCATPPDPRPA
ncbi:MAG: Fur family transcriptional regulator [Acidimicrobiia bacterium]